MPTIAKRDDYDVIYTRYKQNFKEDGTVPLSLHNLLWQTIINRVDGEKLMVFYPVDGESRFAVQNFHLSPTTFTIAKVYFKQEGYIDMSVPFRDEVTYEEAKEICEHLNEELFGILPALGDLIIKSSMPDLPDGDIITELKSQRFILTDKDGDTVTSDHNLETLYKILKGAGLQEQELFVTDLENKKCTVPVKQVYDAFEEGRSPTDLWRL